MRKLLLLGVMLLVAACDQNASHKTIGGTRDTEAVFKAGGPPIRDTATINKDRKDSARLPKKDNTTRGNADPSGRIKNQ